MKVWIKSAIFILFIVVACSFTAVTADATQQTIRVGCVDIENFLKIDSDGNASGYGAEYLNEIKKYTNWDYEYVQGSWSECLEWLKTGKIDLLMPAEYSKERDAEFLFSEGECCLDYVALVGRKDDDSHFYEDYEAFDGMTIGMVRDNYLNTQFEQYAKENHFSFKNIYYATGTELASALENRAVDAIVNGNLEYNNKQKLLAKITYMPAYFITADNNKALMAELNDALHQIFLTNPYYTARLHGKYYDSVERQSISFTRQESEFIKNAQPIEVFIERNNYPMEWYDRETKTCRGIYVELLKLIEKESGLHFKFMANGSESDMRQAMKEGKAYVWGSAYVPGPGRFIEGLTFTSFYFDCNYSMVGKKEKIISMDDQLTIAVLKEDPGVQDMVKKLYPHWNVVSYEGIENCLRSVEESKADVAVLSSWGLSVYEDFLRRDLIVIKGNAMNLPVCMGISENCDPLLVSVLNKSILKIEDSELEGCAFNSILSLKEKVTLMSLMGKYPFYAVMAAAILLVLIFSGFFAVYRSRVHKQQRLILQEKNRELENAVEIQERLRIEAETDSLTGLKNKSNVESDCREYLERYPDKKHALLILDIDDFKEINDTYGHLFGDKILKEFGHVLRSAVGKDDVAARIGGDEFLVFMPFVNDEKQVAEQVEKLYEKIVKTCEISMSCSMGVAVSECPHGRYDELFFEADQALYKAKDNGKNQYVIADAYKS